MESKTQTPTTGAEVPGLKLTRSELAVATALAVVSFCLYIPSFSNSFVDYDDPHYVTQNKVVQKGLTAEGVAWAFTTTRFANWLPVTWLSHMYDCQMFGLNAGGHHATSAVLHAFNAAMLFLALRAMTERLWPSAAVAALFAVHPLRVESVAWVAERKDVLCGTFFMLALLAYAHYSRRPRAGAYLLVVVCHALGLMSKTMLVTLPCLLLLLDFWPLRRLRWGAGEPDAGTPDAESGPAPFFPPRGTGWLVAEKLPLLLLSAVSSAWTLVFQESGGAMSGYRDLTLYQRVANALVSVPRYLLKIVWPADLSVFYPHPGHWPLGKVAAAGGLVLLVSAVAAAAYKRRPYLTVGWFWFLGMLVPVSGIIQVGLQSMADRYTYLPGIGLAVAVVWCVADVLRRRRALLVPTAAATVLVLAAFSVATWRQQRHWVNTFMLFQQALKVDRDNWLAHNMIGTIYAENGERQFNLGNRQQSMHYYSIAEQYTRKSLQLKGDHYTSLHNQGWNLYRLGRLEEAIDLFREAIRVEPKFGFSQIYLGVTLAQLGRLDEAMPYFQEAVKLQPDEPAGHFHLAEALLKKGRKVEAVVHLKETLRLRPDHADAKYWLQQATAPSPATATAPSTQAATTVPAAASAPVSAPVTPPAK